MKESKFWIWFIPLFLILCIGIYLLLVKANTISNNNQENTAKINTDAISIKEEYEKLNEESIKVSLSQNNSYVFINKDSIEELFNKDGILYFGEYSSYASRKNVSLLNDVVATTNINKIYFINIARVDDDYNTYLKEKLNVDKINPGDTYLIKDNQVINSIKVDKYDNDKELTKEQTDKLILEYQEKIYDLIEKCDESC